MKRILSLLTLAIALLTSCENNVSSNCPSPAVDVLLLNQIDFLQCFNDQSFSNKELRQTLAGEWVWVQSIAGWTAETDREQLKGMSIELRESGELLVKQNGEVIEQGVWELEYTGEDWARVKMDPYVEGANGVVRICGDYLMFMLSYVDGPDNYFVRGTTQPCNTDDGATE